MWPFHTSHHMDPLVLDALTELSLLAHEARASVMIAGTVRVLKGYLSVKLRIRHQVTLDELKTKLVRRLKNARHKRHATALFTRLGRLHYGSSQNLSREAVIRLLDDAKDLVIMVR